MKREGGEILYVVERRDDRERESGEMLCVVGRRDDRERESGEDKSNMILYNLQ